MRSKKGGVGGGLVCAHCKKVDDLGTMKCCSRCKHVHYCSVECQKLHWKRGGHKQACGKEEGAQRPEGLPLLFPGPPSWLTDQAAFDQSAALTRLAQRMPSFGLSMVLDIARNQREMDERNRHLDHVYDGRVRDTMSFDEHARLHASAGWTVSKDFYERAIGSVDTPCPKNGMYTNGLPPMSTQYHRPAVPIQRICDHCNATALTMSECECGESFCSKVCNYSPLHVRWLCGIVRLSRTPDRRVPHVKSPGPHTPRIERGSDPLPTRALAGLPGSSLAKSSRDLRNDRGKPRVGKYVQ
jgi:hypothetical protein